MLSKIEKVDTTSSTYNYKIHSRPKYITLGLTNRCNLNCSYCFVNQNPQDMTFEIANQAIKWALKNCGKNIYITFFGGEPLLKFKDIILPLVLKYPQIRYDITTNGILLTSNIIDFFYNHNINILLSFDGSSFAQNSQRNNSFNKIILNIPYLLEKFPNTTARATITKQTIPYLYESALTLEKLGFKKCFFNENKDIYEIWDEKDAQILIQEINKIKNLRIKTNFFDNKNNKFDTSYFRCGLGTTSCAITPEGDIVTCMDYISTKKHIIGNVFSGINKILHENYLLFYKDKIDNLQCEKDSFSLRCWRQIEDNNFLPTSPSYIMSQVLKEINKKE